MWYPVSSRIDGEAVTRDEAATYLRMNPDEPSADLDLLVAAARAHAEAYCNRLFATHFMTWQCDGFYDLGRLPAAPAVEVSSISYTDLAGDIREFPEANFILRPDGVDPRIDLRAGAAWPHIQPGSRVEVQGTFGGTVPEDVHRAMLLLIGDGDLHRENAERPGWTVVDGLLSNHRRGAW